VTHPLPPSLPWTETYSSTGTLLSNYITKLLECGAQGCVETYQQDNPYYPFAAHEEYKCSECEIKKKCMKMNYNNVLKKEHTALHFRSFKNGDGIQKLLARTPDAQARKEWERHTLEDMKSIDNHQHPITYCSRDIIRSLRLLMWQPTYANHLVYTPQHGYNSDTPPKHVHTEIHTVDSGWERLVRIDAR
jgi:hypothetical protein